jgi:hypothetical protein
MDQLNKSSANQTPATAAESTEWDPITLMRPFQANTLEESDGWNPFFGPPVAWSRANMVDKVSDLNYNHCFKDLNFEPFMDVRGWRLRPRLHGTYES